jgi:hypothetical protein
MQPPQPLNQRPYLLHIPPQLLTRLFLLPLTQIQELFHQLAVHKTIRLLTLPNLVLERPVPRKVHVAGCGDEATEDGLQGDEQVEVGGLDEAEEVY